MTKVCIRVCLPIPRRNSFFFFPHFGVLIFLPSHNRHKNIWTKIGKTFADSSLTMTDNRRPAYNSMLPQLVAIPMLLTFDRDKLCKIEAECSEIANSVNTPPVTCRVVHSPKLLSRSQALIMYD